MVIGMKFKTVLDIIADDTRNIYDYILARRHNNIFLQPEQKIHDMVT